MDIILRNNNFHTRYFVIKEVESGVVYLQNKTIGKNHVQNVPTYKYRAWYKTNKCIVVAKTYNLPTNLTIKSAHLSRRIMSTSWALSVGT